MQIRKLSLAALGTLAALTLAACGGADAPAETTTPVATSAAPSVEPSPSPEPETEAPAPAVGDLTAPGTELAIGETALVTYDHFEHGAVPLDVTVTGIRQGAVADLEAAGFDASSLAGYALFYIDATVVKHDLSYPEIAFDAAYSELHGVDAAGNKIYRLSIVGAFDTCPSNAFKAPIDEGEPFALCSIIAVPEGQTVTTAGWFARATDYADAPVVWK